MTALQSVNRELMNIDFSPRAVLGSIGSNMFLLNADSTTKTNLPTSPYSMVAGGHATYDNIYPVTRPENFLHLYLYHLWTAAGSAGSGSGSPPAVTTPPAVRVFGRIPRMDMGTDAGKPPSLAGNTVPTHTNWWKVLQDPDHDSDLDLTFGTDIATYYEGSGDSLPDSYMSVHRYTFCAGVDQIMAAVSTAAVIGSSGTGIIIGQFVS